MKPLLVVIFLFFCRSSYGIVAVAQELSINKNDIADYCAVEALNLMTETVTLSEALATQLDTLLTQAVTSEGASKLKVLPAPGLVLRVETPAGLYFRSIGVRDVNTCEPLKPNEHFQIGNNTKMMTALIIFQLQEEGILSIEDSIADWLPKVANKLPYGNEITIAQLLSHTSGLWDYFDRRPNQRNSLFWQELINPELFTQDFTPENIIDFTINHGSPNYKPGTLGAWHDSKGGWSYNNTGYILLGMIIEAATGKSLEENYIFRIWNIAGMANTYLQSGVPIPGDRVLLPRGYLKPPFEQDTSGLNLSQVWSAGAVVSTAEDMARFTEALFKGKYFTQTHSLSQMLTPSPNTIAWSKDFFYGYGVFVKQGLLGHGGQTFAFDSDIRYSPNKDCTIVLWGNSSENFARIGAVQVATIAGCLENVNVEE